jgi:hypothetical protein
VYLMKVEARVFLLIAVFCFIVAAGYGYWTSLNDGHVEFVGVTALVLSGGLLGLSGSFFWFVSRRIDARPEDRNDAEIAEGAGELGFFSPGSYWPFAIAAAATVVGSGLAFAQLWLIGTGVIILLFMVGGLLFEYYIGGRNELG